MVQLLAPVDQAAARHQLRAQIARLERSRDALAARVATVHRRVAEQREQQAEARRRLAEMFERPADFRGAVIHNHELGLTGCTTYRVVPRLLGGWWRVKISSGCPLGR